MKKNSIFNVDVGTISLSIAPHWAYYICASVFLVLFFVSLWFTYSAFKNKNNYYENDYEKFSWLKNFWYKNRICFWIMINIILILTSIIFFLIASGNFS